MEAFDEQWCSYSLQSPRCSRQDLRTLSVGINRNANQFLAAVRLRIAGYLLKDPLPVMSRPRRCTGLLGAPEERDDELVCKMLQACLAYLRCFDQRPRRYSCERCVDLSRILTFTSPPASHVYSSSISTSRAGAMR